MSVETEETVQRACHYYSKFISPSVVYETFSKDTITFVFEKDAPSKWVAQSVFFVTIGTSLEEEFKKDGKAFGEHSNTIVSAIAVDALEQAKNFTQRLAAGEAETENCDLSRGVDLPSDLYEEAAKIIPVEKIDVSVRDGKLIPQYSNCGVFYWVPSKKKSKK
jgi:hypothetical protein